VTTGERLEHMEELDLRGVICPYNFVKTKLKLESLEIGDRLMVLLDEGEPIRNVPQSITNEGHQILKQERVDHYYLVVIQKEAV
jgi:tRNA 2-thiouridine synthesizing protein A